MTTDQQPRNDHRHHPLPGERAESHAGGLHTLSCGEGPSTVLWVHGYTMDSTLWRPLWRLLPGHRHIGVDLPGHGRSEPLRPGTSLNALAARIRQLAEEQGAEQWVGLSFGSTVVLQMAIDRPEAAARLVLGAPTPAGRPPDPAARKRYIEMLTLRRLTGPTAATGPLAELWMTSPPEIFRGTEQHPELRARLREVIGRHSWAELGNGAMAAISTAVHTREDLAAITADTLVLTGSEDMPAFHANAELLAHTVPSCRTGVVPDCGHLPFLERPVAAAGPIAAHLADGESSRGTVRRRPAGRRQQR